MPINSFGPDWYTATNIFQDGQTSSTLFEVFTDLSKGQKNWSGGGYRGKECLVTKVKYGSRVRKDGRADEMIVASGPVSQNVIELIGDTSKFRTTRFDLQITIEPSMPDRELAVRQYEGIRLKQSAGVNPLGNRKPRLIRSPTGDTLYIGSRESTQRLFRLYDKSVELGFPVGRFWRCEVQYGRDMAQGAALWYETVGGKERPIVDLVCSEFYDVMRWSPLSHYSYAPADFTSVPKEKTTLEAKLLWLETCVRPTIALLIENGLRGEMKAALGIGSDSDWIADFKNDTPTEK